MAKRKPVKPVRRLYRSRTTQMIGGVAGGVAEYFNIDPTLVRFAFVALLFSSGFMLFILYLIAWIIIPLPPRK